MKKVLAIMAAALMAAVGFSQEMVKDNTALSVTKSKFGFDTTVQKLKDVLKAKDLPIFAEFDHQKNAREVGLSMQQTKVIVFGNPKVGTQLMLQEPLISLDLPLKISIIENKDTDVLIKKYHLKDTTIVAKMQALMENIVASINS